MDVVNESIDRMVDYILPQLQQHQKKALKSPFVIGITGLQGSGKSTWAAVLSNTLERNHQLKVVNVSLDDFYHTRDDLIRVKQENRDNPLLQTRGQPGTHDKLLASEFFTSLLSNNGVLVPSFDKSMFNGQGGRVPRKQWQYISPAPPIDVVIFEGWCVGFRPLETEDLRRKWQLARAQDTELAGQRWPTQTIASIALEHLCKINSHLRVYNETFMRPESFQFLVHLDSDDLNNVYRWRLDQEHAQWRARGTGMDDEDVIQFVKGYMPSYELYLDQLRREACDGAAGRLRVLLDEKRSVIRLGTWKSNLE